MDLWGNLIGQFPSLFCVPITTLTLTLSYGRSQGKIFEFFDIVVLLGDSRIQAKPTTKRI